MKTPSLASIYCFSVLILATVVSSTQRCHPADKKVLVRIKKHFNNPNHLSSWDPTTDCCSWYSLTCDLETHRVNSLSVVSADIHGSIPAALGELPYLETLVLRKLTNLSGTIHPAISNLKLLTYLSLSWTHLAGPVPDFLSGLKSLTLLDLSANALTGAIPPSLSHLPNIATINLARNNLSGPIPDSFGNFAGKELPYLYLSHNQLSGRIPASLSKMNFQYVDLSHNRLRGDASVLFGAHKTTAVVDLSRNMLAFDLSGVQVPATMTWLDISHNQISGSIPAGMVSAQLQLLNVSYNRLCGKIPAGGDLQRFDKYSYFHNKCLCGAPLNGCK